MTEPTATELAGLPSFNGLTAEEAQFVYNCEVIGLPAGKAAKLAGMSPTWISRPHLIQARELLRAEVRGSLQVTKADATAGIKDAIERARILAEPMTEIAGWDRLIKLHGLDTPARVDININASVEILQTQIRGLSDAELVKALGANNVIDADFYEVGSGEA